MRRITKLLILAIVSLAGAQLYQLPVSAQTLKIQPLLYRESFKPGEVKKGFINVSNGGANTVTLVTEVQAFKQIDNDGTLQFFDSKDVSAAITPDLKEFELKPREALRLYFAVDSKKLPGGDNFAALFVRTKANTKSGIASNVRVGTLLVIENGDPGPRKASVESLDAGFFQWGNGVRADAKVKNTADPAKTTAFFPVVRSSIWPTGGSTTVQDPPKSPLIFAGITRTVTVEVPTNVIGLYRLDVTAGQNTASKWIFVVSGWWRWVVVVLMIVLPALIAAWIGVRRRRHTHYKAK